MKKISLFNMQLKSGMVGASLVWHFENAHITLNMFQNRCPFLYNSSAFLLSFLCIVWISFYPGTSSLEPFSLFYDLIASYYTKGKWQWRQGDFVLNRIILIRKCFFTSAYFSPFDLKSSLNHKLSSLRAKVCFCDWQINVSIFSNFIRQQRSPNR